MFKSWSIPVFHPVFFIFVYTYSVLSGFFFEEDGTIWFCVSGIFWVYVMFHVFAPVGPLPPVLHIIDHCHTFCLKKTRILHDPPLLKLRFKCRFSHKLWTNQSMTKYGRQYRKEILFYVNSEAWEFESLRFHDCFPFSLIISFHFYIFVLFYYKKLRRFSVFPLIAAHYLHYFSKVSLHPLVKCEHADLSGS